LYFELSAFWMSGEKKLRPEDFWNFLRFSEKNRSREINFVLEGKKVTILPSFPSNFRSVLYSIFMSLLGVVDVIDDCG